MAEGTKIKENTTAEDLAREVGVSRITRPVGGQVSNPAPLKKVDNDETQAVLDGVGTERENHGPLLLAGCGD